MSTDPKSTYYDHGGIEVLDVIQAKLTTEQFQGYLLGNVIKYSLRANWKGDSLRDIGKLRIYAELLLDEMLPPPDERQDQVRERHDIVPESSTCQWDASAALCPEGCHWQDCGRPFQPHPPDRPLASHCPDGGACRHKCGLEPCKAQS